MKRILLHDMDWQAVQIAYDSGLHMRELPKKTGISGSSIARAVACGLLKTRDNSAAIKLSLQQRPRDYSEARSKRSALTNYRADCAFKFDLKKYPEEFDFSLVEKHGWYSPSNRQNNLYGVSRDHMVSVRYGFDNNIDVKVIAHPANCRLMQHNLNASKSIGCSVSIDELQERIVSWNRKYTGD